MGRRAAFRIRAGCVQGGGEGSCSCADTCTPVQERPFCPCGELRGRRAKGTWSLPLPRRAVLPYPTKAPVSRQGTGRHCPAVTPSAEPALDRAALQVFFLPGADPHS